MFRTVTRLSRLFWLAVALLGPAFLARPGDQAASAPKEKQVVQVIGYINVTSGCQQALVDFLRQLDRKYGDRVTLEIVDFGTEEGLRRWRRDGQRCLTVLVDGKPYVDLEEKGKKERVYFYGPPGYTWHHSQVEWAVAKLLGAPLPKLVKTPVVLKAEARLVKAEGEKGPVTVALVTLGRVPVYATQSSSSDKMVADARAVARRLNGLFAKKVTSDEVKVKVQGEEASLYLRGLRVYTITPAVAKAFDAKPKDMVEAWAKILRELLPTKSPSR